MTIRPAIASDVEETLRFAAAMYASVGLEADDAWRALARRDVAARLGRTMFGWVAEAGAPGTLSACGYVTVDDRLPIPGQLSTRHGYVQWVVTDPDARGTGLGKAIMLQIEQWASGEGLEALHLHSSPAARSFYLALGYELSHPVDFPSDLRGAPMRLRLAGRDRRGT